MRTGRSRRAARYRSSIAKVPSASYSCWAIKAVAAWKLDAHRHDDLFHFIQYRFLREDELDREGLDVVNPALVGLWWEEGIGN